jgi:hypothetical protein
MERVLTIRGNKPTRPISDFAMLARGLGDVYYVDSNNGNDAQSGKSPEQSVATLDYAIGLCTANQGDVIYVLPGHAETVSEASGVDADVEGISIIGLGDGADRPTFTFSAVDATMTIAAASVVVKNLLIKPSIDAVVSPIVVSAAGCSIDVEIQDATYEIECECGILTTADADNLTVNLKYRGFIAGDACLNAMRLVGVDTARVYVDFYGVAATAIVEFHTTNCHDIDITGLFYNQGTSLTKNVVDTAGSSTWSARGWDGNSNANFSGGDNAALASDDASAVATIASTAVSEIGSVGVKASTAISEIGSVGVKASTAVSEIGSVGVKASTAVSEIGSVGVKASTAISEIGSVGGVAGTINTRASTAVSEIGSVGVKASTAISEIGSVGVKASTAVSEIGSVGVKASTAVSEIGSVGGVAATINTRTSTAVSEIGSVGVKASTAVSEIGSVGVKSSTIISMIGSLATSLATKLSVIDSQIS